MAAALTIRWTSLAAGHLEAAHAYLVEENPKTAGRLIDRILAGIEMLQRYPNLGRNGRVQGTRELVISGTPFVVPYRVSRTQVQILAVLHGARRWPERL